MTERRGLFAALYPDRGSHYWHTPSRGKVDKNHLTQFGKAMARLGIRRTPPRRGDAQSACSEPTRGGCRRPRIVTGCMT